MARNKGALSNIDNSDLANYPNGRIQNNTGAGNGTPVNEIVYGDLHEFFAKLMRNAGITYNGLPDNETNGYQLIQAMEFLAGKNDVVTTLTSNESIITIPQPVGRLKNNEYFLAKTTFDKGSETQIQGSDTTTKNVTFIGDFLNNEYVFVVNTSTSVVLIRIVDSSNIESIIAGLSFLKAASQVQEDAGSVNNVATTPLTNKTVFEKRVIGSDSGNYLASATRNGLMSIAQFNQLANLAADRERNYGTISGDLPNPGSIGSSVANTGDITSATVNFKDSAGAATRVVFDNPMDDTNYYVDISVESLGAINRDNDINPPIFKIISVNTVDIYIEENASVSHSLKLHLRTIQR